LQGALLTLGIVSVSQAQPRQNFDLVNETGANIAGVYISPHSGPGSGGWGKSWGEIPNADKKPIDFSERGLSGCVYDLRVVLSNGEDWQSTTGFDLCQIQAIGIFPDGEIVALQD